MPSALDQLRIRADQWNVTIDRIGESPTSVIGFGVRDGLRVVLKISKHHGDESHSGEVLRAFAGAGTVRVYESDTGVVLLEELTPGEQLVNLVRRGADEDATKILGEIIAKLSHHAAPQECPTVADWGRGFDRYLNSGDQQIPESLVHEARELYQDLVTSQRVTMLLHGDLHHYNVLFDTKRGWVAIDPKGVIGELEYEVGALVRNPVELPDLFTSAITIECRLRSLASSLQLDYRRALCWSFAQSVLSAIWDFEDSYSIENNNTALLLAEALKPMLGTSSRI
jgi:streptomycin 6-kinase